MWQRPMPAARAICWRVAARAPGRYAGSCGKRRRSNITWGVAWHCYCWWHLRPAAVVGATRAIPGLSHSGTMSAGAAC